MKNNSVFFRRRENKWGMSLNENKNHRSNSKLSFDKKTINMSLKEADNRFLNVFQEFCSKTSMHGWGFIGAPNTSHMQRLFWLLVIFGSAGGAVYLLQDTVDNFTSYTTKINIEDRSANLKETYFPSVVVCNINPLRKSFIYWIHDNLQQDGWTNVSKTSVFDLIGRQFF